MLITIDDLLSAQECRSLRSRLDAADWRDGSATAGSLSRAVKQNQQLEPGSVLARELGARVLQALHAHPRFVSAALPRVVLPPRFNRYTGGGRYGVHVDAAVMRHDDDGSLVRSDLAATLFLAEPGDYDGGELRIETGFGAQAVKLPAGALVLYPASSLHEVTPVTRGARLAAFCWIQSLVPDAPARALLFDLDQDIQRLSMRLSPGDPTLVSLTGVYHNLLRRWTR